MKNFLLIVALVASFVGTVVPANATSTGSLIKGTSFNSIYYYGIDGKRYVFPNDKTFYSWFDNFSGVTTVSDSELASIPMGGNVTYRPGKKMIKIQTDPKVYAVDKNGTLRWIISEQVAKGLYGTDWAKQVDDVPDIFFTNYRLGEAISSIGDFDPQTRISAADSISSDKRSDAISQPYQPPPTVVKELLPVQVQPTSLKPIITKFEASSYEGMLGDTVKITWDADNAVSCVVGESKDITIPFNGRLPHGDMTVTLAENGNNKLPLFHFYAICADKDWNTTMQTFDIKINTNYWIQEPTVISRIGTDVTISAQIKYADFWSANCTDKNGLGVTVSQNRVYGFFTLKESGQPIANPVTGETYNCTFRLWKGTELSPTFVQPEKQMIITTR